MTLVELKDFITNKIIPSDFMIFVKKDNNFLVSQYIQAINNISNGGIQKIASIYEPQQSSLSLLTAPENIVNIINVETFSERAESYSQFENTIVICEQVDKSILNSVEKYIIEFPKLEEWQIADYAKTICPNIDEEDILWLIRASNNNIERVINELEKVYLFPTEEQKAVFSSIRFDPQTDLYNIEIFGIVNALVDGDTLTLLNFIKHNGYEILEPIVLANRALTSLKNIVLATQNLSASECGMSTKQLNMLKYKYRSLNIEAIKYKIKFLTNFDLMLKTSRLDLSKRDMLSYLINNLCFKITL